MFIYSSSLIVDSEYVFGVRMKIMKTNFPEDPGGGRVCVCVSYSGEMNDAGDSND